VLSKILHATESRNLVSGEKNGFPVKNSQGQKWQTRADDHLRISLDQMVHRNLHLTLKYIVYGANT
jgi:hypothetical protein